MTYERPQVRAPRLSGIALRSFVSALESGIGPLLAKKLMDASGLGVFRRTRAGTASPIQVPLPFPTRASSEAAAPTALAARAIAAAAATPGEPLETVAAFVRAYASGHSDPV